MGREGGVREGAMRTSCKGCSAQWVAPTGALLAWAPVAHASAALVQKAAYSAGM